MKIAMVIWGLGAGGAERVLTSLANAWCLTKDVTVITITDDVVDHYGLSDSIQRRTLYSVGSQEAAPPEPTDMPSDLPRMIERVGDLVRNVRIVYRLRTEIQRIQPDVAISFIDRTNILTLLATRGLGVPVVVSERTDPRHHQVSRAEESLRRLTYPRADGLVVQTESVRRWARDIVSEPCVSVIPNPVVVEPEVADLNRREPIIAAVGRLIRSKGYDHLLRAFAAIATRHPEWTLQVAGQGPELEGLQSLAGELEIADRVDFLGLIPDTSVLLRRAAVFAQASRYEGFPNALLEAMAWGLAPLSTDCPSGPAEIIEHGVNGLLVPTHDIGAFEDGLDYLLSSRNARISLGRAARESMSRFALPTVLRMWDEVVAEVLARRAR